MGTEGFVDEDMFAILRAVIISDGLSYMVRVFAQTAGEGFSYLLGRFSRKLGDLEVAAGSFEGNGKGGCALARDHGIDLPVARFTAIIDRGGTLVDG